MTSPLAPRSLTTGFASVCLALGMLSFPACVIVGDSDTSGADAESSEAGSGTTDPTGDGDGDAPGDGDGDPAGDGDGDGDVGDGDGDVGDGDGDIGDGDGDVPSCVGVIPLADEPQGDGDGDIGDGDGDIGDGDGDGDIGDGDGDGDGGDGDGDVGDGDGDVGDGDGDPEPPCVDCAPYWRLYDFQPQSCGYEQTYGLDSFEGHVTMVAMLAGWCSYCQSQATKMEQMRIELQLEGYDVQFMAVNAISAASEENQQKLVERCAFPLFQDTLMQAAWSAHNAGKDDIVIYAADGTVSAELPIGGDLSTNLSTDEGYDNVKQAILDAHQ